MPGSSPSTEMASARRQEPPDPSVSAPRSVSMGSVPDASTRRVPDSEIWTMRSIPSRAARDRIDSTWYCPAARTGRSAEATAPPCAQATPPSAAAISTESVAVLAIRVSAPALSTGACHGNVHGACQGTPRPGHARSGKSRSHALRQGASLRLAGHPRRLAARSRLLPDEEGDGGQNHAHDHGIRPVEPRGEQLAVLTDFHADPPESQAPGERAHERVDDELAHRHAGDAGGEGDEGPDHRKEARDQHRDLAPAVEESLRPVEVLGVHEDEAAVLLDERAAAVLAGVVRGNRAHDAPHRARQGAAP